MGPGLIFSDEGYTQNMRKSEPLVLGSVMAWVVRAGAELGEPIPIDATLPAVFEYCPAEKARASCTSITQRMKELFAAGFTLIALVCCDPHSSELSIRGRNDISKTERSQLAEEAEVIFWSQNPTSIPLTSVAHLSESRSSSESGATRTQDHAAH